MVYTREVRWGCDGVGAIWGDHSPSGGVRWTRDYRTWLGRWRTRGRSGTKPELWDSVRREGTHGEGRRTRDYTWGIVRWEGSRVGEVTRNSDVRIDGTVYPLCSFLVSGLSIAYVINSLIPSSPLKPTVCRGGRCFVGKWEIEKRKHDGAK